MVYCTHMEIKKIVFLFGGPGDEHAVSCATAQTVLPAFNAVQYTVKPVFITKEAKWVVAEAYVSPAEAWSIAQDLQQQAGVPSDIALDTIETDAPYAVFIGLFGQYGEDGTVQSLLDSRGLVYTGSDAQASALAMNKPKVLQLLQNEAVATPEFLEITSATTETDIREFVQFYGLPFVVLPAESGSSVGVTIVQKEDELKAAIATARERGERVLLSQYIAGREITCGVLVKTKIDLVALPPVEVVPTDPHVFWDYDAKYELGQSQITVPADLPEGVASQAQQLALRVHRLVGADGYSRTDMILDEGGELRVLEVNTLPTLLTASVFTQSAQAEGLTLTELLTTIVENIDRSERDYATFTLDMKEPEGEE